MATRISTWAYPWDIADEGAAAALDWLRDAGFDAIELCPNYHAIATLSPRNRRRSMFYSEQGAVYVPARMERYGRIKPRLFDEPAVLEAYGAVSDAVGARGMQLNAWVIGMFQPWMARAYPDVAIENAFGHRSYAQSCPASPDVQQYLAALVADVCDQYAVSSVTLENAGHPAFAYGWVRERILVTLSPWTRFLAGLCFCESCTSAAQARGVDAARVRQTVAAELRDRLESEQADASGDDLAALAALRGAADELFGGYLEAREQTAAGLVRAVAQALEDTGVRLSLTAASAGWSVHGLRLPDLLPSIDEVMLPNPTEQPQEAGVQASLVRGARPDIALTVTEPSLEEVQPDSSEFAERVGRIAEIGVDRVMAYNFGLRRPETLRRIGEVLRATLNR